MAKQQKTYTREFKLEAVRLVKSSGKPMSQIARELGVSDTALYHWCKQLAEQREQAWSVNSSSFLPLKRIMCLGKCFILALHQLLFLAHLQVR